MSEDFETPKDDLEQEVPNQGHGQEGHSDYKPADTTDGNVRHQLSGMYQNWFLDYASYVILERAVPHIMDGLKPVQRRILHSMRRMEDGRYNKVANIVGHTMQFHPHGDASIGDALVQLGQKDLLIDCQGNWGNILTGDSAAAPRYIEARLSKFALDVVFNPKTTEWKLSYDGRNREPVTLPVKFPLLLAQGVEGIAVGLSSKILPHNFNELCEAAISYLHEEPFQLYPDFQTGGAIDVSKYNDGERGGSVRIRAKIEKVDNKTLAIREIPYGKTVASVCDSIVKASEKGKIKIRKVEDLTSDNVEILVHLGGRVVGQDHRRPLCLYRLRGEHIAQLLRDRRPEAPLPDGERRAAQVGGQHQGPAAPRAGDTPGRNHGKPALRLAGEDIHRGTHLQGQGV